MLRFGLASELLVSRPIEDIAGDIMGEMAANGGLEYAMIFGGEADFWSRVYSGRRRVTAVCRTIEHLEIIVFVPTLMGVGANNPYID